MDRAFIAMGDSAGIARDGLRRWMSELKTTWGSTDEEISAAVRSAGGKLGDYKKGMDLVAISSQLAAAKGIDLAQSTDMVNQVFALFGGRISQASTDQGKFRVVASELNLALKAVGGNTDLLSTFLSTTGVRAAGAGQSLETVLAVLSQLGAVAPAADRASNSWASSDKLSEFRLTSPDRHSQSSTLSSTKPTRSSRFWMTSGTASKTLGITDTRDQLMPCWATTNFLVLPASSS